MSHWLKWRLAALFGVVALLIGASVLQAQNDYPAPAKTPEEAAEQFFALLDEGENPLTESDSPFEVDFDWDAVQSYIGCLSRYQITAFSERAPANGPPALFYNLAEKAHRPQYSGSVARQEHGKTIVGVVPAATPKPREVVVIAEDGGYRVDVFATFGQWNNLSGLALDKAIYRYTGVISASLAADAGFLATQRRRECQTNLKDQMLGILQYMEDYDGKLPPARQWNGAILDYIGTRQVFNCPSLPKDKGNGYAYNQYLSQLDVEDIDAPSTTISIYETSNLRFNVFGTGTGRAFRHSEGWNLAFIDGHIKWFSKKQPIDKIYDWKGTQL